MEQVTLTFAAQRVDTRMLKSLTFGLSDSPRMHTVNLPAFKAAYTGAVSYMWVRGDRKTVYTLPASHLPKLQFFAAFGGAVDRSERFTFPSNYEDLSGGKLCVVFKSTIAPDGSTQLVMDIKRIDA